MKMLIAAMSLSGVLSTQTLSVPVLTTSFTAITSSSTVNLTSERTLDSVEFQANVNPEGVAGSAFGFRIVGKNGASEISVSSVNSFPGANGPSLSTMNWSDGDTPATGSNAAFIRTFGAANSFSGMLLLDTVDRVAYFFFGNSFGGSSTVRLNLAARVERVWCFLAAAFPACSWSRSITRRTPALHHGAL